MYGSINCLQILPNQVLIQTCLKFENGAKCTSSDLDVMEYKDTCSLAQMGLLPYVKFYNRLNVNRTVFNKMQHYSAVGLLTRLLKYRMLHGG